MTNRRDNASETSRAREGAVVRPGTACLRARLVVLVLFLASSAMAQLNSPSSNAPPALRDSPVVPAPFLQGIGIDQKLDEQLPLELRFRDEQGQQVKLGDYFGKRPVLLTLVYYGCPGICTMTLNTLTTKLHLVPQTPGEDFEIVIVSFKPSETPGLAAQKKASYMKEYKRPGTEAGWHFLTGDEDQIQALAAAVGFRYQFDPPSGEYIHPAGLMVATPAGKLSKYYYGTDYEPRDLRLGISEASGGRIGTLSQRLELFCYRYDMTKGKYTFAVWRVVRAAGLATMLALGSTIFFLVRRERRRSRSEIQNPKSEIQNPQ